ncbi:hypothetical protein [Agrobacterium rubi]|nr:hypothetical protein [Agrobacterium rubi]MBP1879798.1 hypothetical protein [Agrobacterium rubi]
MLYVSNCRVSSQYGTLPGETSLLIAVHCYTSMLEEPEEFNDHVIGIV